MTKTYRISITVTTLACLLLATGCATPAKVAPERKFLRENPEYKLTEFPLPALEREVYWRHRHGAMAMASLIRDAEQMTKEEVLDRMRRIELVREDAYKSAVDEVREIEKLLADGAKVYWFSSAREDGFIILGSSGEVLMRTGL
ncbi:MAG: hypothetical protein IH623_07195 [Verrucomicrobia bacterium]|nr:hypothetical protein [Verrucomicrobiota bacterium]